jgi:hypothetical protein
MKPNFSEYPAIDGITKPEEHIRELEDCMGRGCFRTVSKKESIRPDVLTILQMSDARFDEWLTLRMDAVSGQLTQWNLIGSIPDLSNGTEPWRMTSTTNVKNIIEQLEAANDYLIQLKDKRATLQ